MSGVERSDKKLDIDGNTLQIASFSDRPRQPVNFIRTAGYQGKQIRQLQARLDPPTVNAQAPLTIQRRNLLNGTFQYRVQFITPTAVQDPSYQGTSIVIQTPSGTQRFVAGAAQGPIIFTAAASTAPSSIALQQSNANSSSEVGLGTGNSRTLIQQ